MKRAGNASSGSGEPRFLASDYLLIALIVAVPLMKPAIRGQLIAADLLFLAVGLAALVEVALGLRRVRWIPGYGALLFYVAALVPSLFATSDLAASVFKLGTEFYLIGLAAVTAALVDDLAKFRRVLLAWLAATALVIFGGLLGLTAFFTGWQTWLFDYNDFGFGSLPPGPYPRLALTFFNANMACNYLTVGLGVAYVSRTLGYISPRFFWLFITGLAVASLSTLSPGLGGIALLGGFLVWMEPGQAAPRLRKIALLSGLSVAVLTVAALALTPVYHSTATFRLDLPEGLAIYPASRLLIWIAAFKRFLAHPLVGVGIGIDPVHVAYDNPSGFQVLTDAHNMFLSIAAQCGLVGLVGLFALIVMAIRKGFASTGGSGGLAKLVLCATFLDVFIYQGIGGSFEDTRHIWLLLGLLMATSQIRFDPKSAGERAPA